MKGGGRRPLGRRSQYPHGEGDEKQSASGAFWMVGEGKYAETVCEMYEEERNQQ